MSNADVLETLRLKLSQFAQQRDWEQFHSPKNLSMALIGEAAELVEIFQWLTEQASKNLGIDKIENVRLELADIFIYLIRIADVLDINLIEAVNDKIEINEKRYPVNLVYGKAKRASEYKHDED